MLHTTPHPTPALSLFAWMCDCLRAAIAPHARTDTPSGRLLGFLHGYLARAVTRLDALFIRWRAGTLKPTSPGKPRAAAARQAAIRLPRGEKWLIKRVQKTAIACEQLRLLHEDPEFQTFLREVPRAARLLRPLCTAAGFIPPGTKPAPRRVRSPRPKPVPPPGPPRQGKYTNAQIRRYRPGRIPAVKKSA